MDKAEFLKELEKHLAILNESEQKDIMDEYAQHIDMKMERGMSESEAIGDFGDIRELAVEILEAYHVNPQYGVKKKGKLAVPDEHAVKELKVKSAHAGKWVWDLVTGFFGRIKRGIGKLFLLISRPFSNRHNNQKESEKSVQHKNIEKQLAQKRKAAGKIVEGAGNGMRRFFSVILYLIQTCVRWFWNGCMIFIVLLTGFSTLFAIFGLGVLVVLLAQGYPLAGFTIGCLGATMIGLGVTALAVSLIRMKKQPKKLEEIVVQEVLEHA